MSVFDELILRGTAIVDRSAGEGRGTAFRIAPRYAVTAGHVVDDGAGGVVPSVQLDFGNGKTCTARVVAHSAHPGLGPGGKPEEGFWTFPDLAVLELPEDVLPEVLCVLMTEIMPQQRELRVAGMGVPFEKSLRVSVEGATFEIQDDDRFLRFTDVVVRRGHSGGPVLSAETGAVIGVVKGSAHTTLDSGGIAAPLLAGLRAVCEPELYTRIVTSHDRYHARNGKWRYAQRPDTWVTERWERFIGVVALLAHVEGPADREELGRLHDEICRDAADESEIERMVAWRDFAEFLVAEVHEGYAQLRRLCVEFPAVATVSEEVESELGDLASLISDRLNRPVPRRRLESQSASGHRTLIGVITAQVTADQRTVPHHAELFRVIGGGEDAMAVAVHGANAEAADFRSAADALRGLLHEQLRNSPVKVALEIALPDEHLGAEEPHRWERAPEDPRRFSSGYPIDLRRTATWERDDEQRRVHRERWTTLDTSDCADGLGWLECGEARSLGELQAYIEDYHGVGVPEPPNADVFRLADLNAMPVLLWRQSRCTDRGHGRQCAGAAFRSALCSSFADLPPTRWAERVDALKRTAAKRALAPEAEGFAWRDIVYLIERPGHHKRVVHLAGPHRFQGSGA